MRILHPIIGYISNWYISTKENPDIISAIMNFEPYLELFRHIKNS
jgi:hypothetical protein